MKSKNVIAVYCPKCETKLKAKLAWVGQRARCANCSHRFEIVTPEESDSAEPVDSQVSLEKATESGSFAPPADETDASRSGTGREVAINEASSDTSVDFLIEDPLSETDVETEAKTEGEMIGQEIESAMKDVADAVTASAGTADNGEDASDLDVLDILNAANEPDEANESTANELKEAGEVEPAVSHEEISEVEQAEVASTAEEVPPGVVAASESDPTETFDEASASVPFGEGIDTEAETDGDAMPESKETAVAVKAGIETSPCAEVEAFPVGEPVEACLSETAGDSADASTTRDDFPSIARVRGRIPHREGERIAISGTWTEMLDWGRRPVVVELDPDLGTIFQSKQFDPLWPKDEEYCSFVDSLDDATAYLQSQWTICYLHHPRISVVLEMLTHLGHPFRLSVSQCLIGLLGHENVRVRSAVAEALWTKGSLEVAHAMRQLKERGAESGIESLCKACPEEYRSELEAIYHRNFVDWPAGVETVNVAIETETNEMEDEDASDS